MTTPSTANHTMRAAEANRIEADFLQNRYDLEAALAFLTIPDNHIAPVSKDLCLGFIHKHRTLTGTPEEMVSAFVARGFPVLFRRDGRYYDTFEEVQWE